MNVIVFDLEWNQVLEGRTRNKNLSGEIIQIGAAIIDEDCNIKDTFSCLIKPVIYRKMNRHVADLTLISDKDLESGISFKEAIISFKQWCGDDAILISWGPDDISMLKHNLRFFNMDYEWLPETYDGQLMFDDMEMQEDRQWPLNYALFHFNEKPDGAHNALVDVISTVKVLKHLDLNDGLTDEYFRCDYPGED